jgi:ketosteroid isomerase-like protein
MRFGLCTALAVSLASGAIAHPRDGHKASVSVNTVATAARPAATVVDSFHAALGRGDTKSALRFLDEKVVIFESGGVERSKAEYASHHLAADAAFTQAVPSKVIRRTAEAVGNAAWIATEGRTMGTFKDKAVDQLTTETMVLRRTGGMWKITHIHWSSTKAGK